MSRSVKSSSPSLLDAGFAEKELGGDMTENGLEGPAGAAVMRAYWRVSSSRRRRAMSSWYSDDWVGLGLGGGVNTSAPLRRVSRRHFWRSAG